MHFLRKGCNNLPPIEIASQQEKAEQLLMGDVWILFAQSSQLQTDLKKRMTAEYFLKL